MSDDKYLKQHQLMAQGKPLPSGDFGVDQFKSAKVNGPSGEKMLADHERTAGPPINGNQANPKH